MDNHRELDMGATFRNTFDILGKHWQVPVLLAVGLYVIVGFFGAVALSTASTGNFISAALFGILGFVISIIGSLVYQGAIVLFARDAQSGQEPPSIGTLINEAMPYIGALFLTGLLAGLAIFVGLILLVIPGIWLAISFAFATIVVVNEDLKYTDALKRSMELVKGNWWRMLGVIIGAGILVGILGGIASSIVTGILGENFFGWWMGDIASAVFMPISGLVAWSAYWQLTAAETPDELPEATPDQGTPPPTPGV